MNFLRYQVNSGQILILGWQNFYDDSWKSISGCSVITVADFFQLFLARGKVTFSKFFDKDSIKHLLDLQFLLLFSYLELIEVVRQLINCLPTFSEKFELLILMMIEKLYSKQDLYVNLIKTIKNIPYMYIQRTNLQWEGTKLF